METVDCAAESCRYCPNPPVKIIVGINHKRTATINTINALLILKKEVLLNHRLNTHNGNINSTKSNLNPPAKPKTSADR